MTDKNNGNQACTRRRIEITASDLPLSCPPRKDRVWDAHPRVYLPMKQPAMSFVPYCDTEYVLKEFT